MHELPFVMGLLEESERTAREEGLTQLTRICVEVGELSGIEPDCVRLYFETASEGTVAENAELEILKRPAMLQCVQCRLEFEHDVYAASGEGRNPFICPHCGGDGVLMKGTGTGARLLQVEGR